MNAMISASRAQAPPSDVRVRKRMMSGNERPMSARQPIPENTSQDRPQRQGERAADGERDAVNGDNEGPVEGRGRLGDLEMRPQLSGAERAHWSTVVVHSFSRG
eukprot:8579648-Alexandrium_andersonii.AAC.1